MWDLIVELIVIALMVMIIGLIISYIFMYLQSPQETLNFQYWWVIALSFALTGIIVHLICEFSGLNTWYCKNGNACKKLWL